MRLSDKKLGFYEVFSSSSHLSLFSLFLALGIGLQTLDQIVSPFLVPGFKIGLSHLVTLLSLVYFSWEVVLFLVVLRVILASLLFGFLFSPIFYLSFFPGIVSTLSMVLLFIFFRQYLSFWGLSLTGSFFHNIFQLITAAILLSSTAVFSYLSLFLILGVVAGTLNGFLANYLIGRLVSLKANS